MRALDEYITRELNRAHPDQRVGGVSLLSLHVPIPPPGSPEPRYRWLPLADFPRPLQRHYWYTTASEARSRRCTEPP